MLKAKLAGLGSYLPERRVTSEEIAQNLGIPSGWIERVTGVCERRYVSDETVASMGTEAARQACTHAGIALHEIDCIIGASATPQQVVPCTATFFQRALGLEDTNCPCFDVDATCLSFLFALHTAAHFVASGAYRNILIVSSEITTLTRNPEERESAVLFGDAAAAAIISRADEDEPACIWHAAFATDSRGAELTQVLGGGNLHHPNDPTTTPQQNRFAMRGKEVYKMTARASVLPGHIFHASGIRTRRHRCSRAPPGQQLWPAAFNGTSGVYVGPDRYQSADTRQLHCRLDPARAVRGSACWPHTARAAYPARRNGSRIICWGHRVDLLTDTYPGGAGSKISIPCFGAAASSLPTCSPVTAGGISAGFVIT